MNDALNVEKLLYGEQIESHQSQFTNTRLHMLELTIDQRRIIMRDDPTIENILSYCAALEAFFSYLQSMRQYENKEEAQDTLEKRIVELKRVFEEIHQYWSYFKFKIVDNNKNPLVVKFIRKYPEKYNVLMQERLVQLSTAASDKLRVAYQGMRYYFRQGRVRTATGIEGDVFSAKINRLKHQKKKSSGDDDEP